MTVALGWVLVLVFATLAAWHVRKAVAPGRFDAAVSSVAGKALFASSTAATFGVAVGLAACAALVAVTAGLIVVPFPPRLLSAICGFLALALAARAIGEFRCVGFFKRVRGSRFARLDTLVDSPLCLVLAVATAAVALEGGS